MEVAGHEITVAKAKNKTNVKATHSEVDRGKVTCVNIQEKNVNFFYLIKAYENGDVLVKVCPKNVITSTTDWTVLN